MPEINIQIEYTEANEFARGGQGVLYYAKNGDGRRLVVKQYFQPASEEDRKELHAYIASSYRFADVFAKRSHQALFAPFHHDYEKCIEVMDGAPADVTTVSAVISKWKGQGLCGLERAKLAAKCICSLLGALEKFHTADASGPGCVHRDIKPENLFVGGLENETPTVYPIDFGCCAEIESDCSYFTTYSEGFSHPDLLEEEETSIQSDIYSACAVFLAMLLDKPEGMNLFHSLSLTKELQSWNLPYGVEWKIRKIVKKTVEFGYNSAESLRKDFELLLQIIAQRGIHEEVLVDLTAQELKLVKKRIYGESFDQDLLPELDGDISGNTLILAPGGSGKTTALIDRWQKELASGTAIPVYISLASFETADRPYWDTYIRDHILSDFFQVGRTEENRSELDRLFKNGKKRIHLLLDSVNESLNSDRLGSEVSKLLQYPKVEVILASRHSNIHWGCIKEFKTVKILPLSETLVNRKLENAGFQKAAGRLLDTLTRPFFLCRYLEIGKPKKYEDSPKTPGEILFKYHQYLIDAFAAAEHESTRLLLWECCLYQFLPGASFRIGSMTFDSGEFSAICQDMGVAEAEAYISILEDCGLVYQTGKNRFKRITYYQFAHQHYLHFYQSLHAAGQIFELETGLPEMLKGVIPEEVLLFLAEIWNVYQAEDGHSGTPVSIEDWLQTHVAGKSGAATVVRNLLEVLKYQKQNQLQGICFDNLDFSESNFYHCNLEGATFRDAVLPGHAFISDFHRHPIDKLLIAPKTKKLITSARDETKLIVWNLDGNYLFTVDAENTIDGFDISFDEAYLAVRSGSFENSQIQIFSLDNGRRINTRPCGSAFTGALFCFRPNTYDLLINTVKMGLSEYSIFNENYRSVLRSVSAYTPDKSMLLTCVRNGKRYELGMYSSTDFQKEKTFAFESDNSYSFLFSYDGKQIWGVPMSPCEIKEEICPIVIDVETGTVQCPEFSISNHEIIGALKTHLFSSTKVWDYQTGKDVSFLYGYRPQTVHRICFSDDGEYLGIIKDDCDVSVIHTETLEATLQFQATMRDIKGVRIGDVRFVSPDIIMRYEPRGAVDVIDLEDVTMIRLFTLQPKDRLEICKTPRYIIRIKEASTSFELWDAQEARCLVELRSKLPLIKTAEYFPEEDKLVLIEGAFIRGNLKCLPVAIHIYGVSDGSYTTKRYGDEQATALSAAEFIEKRIVIGMNAGKVEILNLSGSSLHIGKVHSGIIDRIVPVHKKPFFISCDKRRAVCVWNLRTLECMPLDGLKIDISRGINVVLDYTEILPEALMRIQYNSDLSYTELEYPEGKLYWIMKDFFPEYCGISTTDRDVLLVQAPLGEVEAYWLPTGEVICFLDELRSHEQIASADISADGLRLAVIAENGKTEIYEREDLHSTSWRAIVWDVLDVDSIWGVDFTQAKLVCNDYIREQLRLNGAILPEKE